MNEMLSEYQKLACEINNDLIFEYTLETDTCILFEATIDSNGAKQFLKLELDHFSDRISIDCRIQADYIKAAENILVNGLSENSIIKFKFAKSGLTKYAFAEVKTNRIYEDKILTKIIGTINDIEDDNHLYLIELKTINSLAKTVISRYQAVYQLNLETDALYRLCFNNDSFTSIKESDDAFVKIAKVDVNFVHPRDRDKYLKIFNKDYIRTSLINNNENFTYQVIDTKTGVYFWNIATIMLLVDENPLSALIFIQNVDEMKISESIQQKYLANALAIAQKVNKEHLNMVMSISKSLSTPIDNIKKIVHSIKTNKENNIEPLNDIISNSDALLEIINDFRDYTKLDNNSVVLEQKEFFITELIKEIKVNLYSLLEDKQINLYVDYDLLHYTSYKGDLKHITQILYNLLSNAVKASKQSSSIELIIKDKLSESAYCDVEFTIRDYGCGMDVELFRNPYKLLNQETPSLGLPLVKILVELMNGVLNVESTINVGTTFSVNIPLRGIVKNEKFSKDEFIIDEKILNNKNVLLIENYEPNLDILKTILEVNTMIVSKCNEEDNLMNLYNSKAFDIIIIDTACEIDYEQVIGDIRNINVDIPIIALVSSKEQIDHQLLLMGISDFVVKPVNVSMLMKTICYHLK